MMKLSVQNFWVEVLYSLIEDLVSHTFKFRIYEEKLTWTQLLFKIRNINFVDDIVRINICCSDRKAVLGVFIWT